MSYSWIITVQSIFGDQKYNFFIYIYIYIYIKIYIYKDLCTYFFSWRSAKHMNEMLEVNILLVEYVIRS